MRLSAKSRYGLAALVCMAESGCDALVTVASMSEKLEISRLYLEQVFSFFKRGGIVKSAKGARGGYHLSKPAEDITAFEILKSTESSLFEKSGDSASDKIIEKTLRETVFNPLDESVEEALSRITLRDITDKMNADGGNPMYYI